MDVQTFAWPSMRQCKVLISTIVPTIALCNSMYHTRGRACCGKYKPNYDKIEKFPFLQKMCYLTLGRPGISLSISVATWYWSILVSSAMMCAAAPLSSFLRRLPFAFTTSDSLWVKSSWKKIDNQKLINYINNTKSKKAQCRKLGKSSWLLK